MELLENVKSSKCRGRPGTGSPSDLPGLAPRSCHAAATQLLHRCHAVATGSPQDGPGIAPGSPRDRRGGPTWATGTILFLKTGQPTRCLTGKERDGRVSAGWEWPGACTFIFEDGATHQVSHREGAGWSGECWLGMARYMCSKRAQMAKRMSAMISHVLELHLLHACLVSKPRPL